MQQEILGGNERNMEISYLHFSNPTCAAHLVFIYPVVSANVIYGLHAKRYTSTCGSFLEVNQKSGFSMTRISDFSVFFLKKKTERSDTAYEKNNASMLWSETHIMLHLEYEMLRLFLLKVLQYCLFMGPQRTASCVGLKRSVQTSEQEIPCLGDVNPLKTKIWDNKTYYICYYLFFFTFWINICFDCFIYKGVKVIWLIYFLFLGSNQIGLSDTESNRLIPLKNGLELDQFIIKSKL